MGNDIAGVILAGGRARRMGGGDKPLITVAGKTLLDRAVERLAPQVGPLLLNANGDAARFASFGLPVRADVIGGYGGPLVGILTGLEWAADMGCRWLVTAAGDTPLFPTDLVARLGAAVRDQAADMAMARSGERVHPVFSLWPVAMAPALRQAITQEDLHKVETFMDRFRTARVEWPVTPFDPFFNVNTPEEIDQLVRIVTHGADAPR